MVRRGYSIVAVSVLVAPDALGFIELGIFVALVGCVEVVSPSIATGLIGFLACDVVGPLRRNAAGLEFGGNALKFGDVKIFVV
jgi:hypothetical protein